jgi:phenylacetic acid degradation operon negative regulatory protein
MLTAHRALCSADVAPQRGQVRPRSLVLYVYGAFVRRLGGWIAFRDLARLMEDLGVEASTVRAVLTRMRQRDLVVPDRRAGVAGYALTPTSWAILDEGDRRIMAARQPAALADGWVLVVFNIPESRRDQRHQIRGSLTWLGFGTVAPGVWIAPRRLRSEGRAALAALEHSGYVEFFDIAPGELTHTRQLVARCWDLQALEEMYTRFSARWEPALRRWSGTRPPDERSAFVDCIHAIAGWRKLPFLDPGLPPEVLPAGWSGERATWIYFTLLARLDATALAYVRSIAHGFDTSGPQHHDDDRQTYAHRREE